MNFHDFPRILGKSECISHPTPQDVCRPNAYLQVADRAVHAGAARAVARAGPLPRRAERDTRRLELDERHGARGSRALG